jgi:hypothetical protein
MQNYSLCIFRRWRAFISRNQSMGPVMSKRELVDTCTDRRYVRRDENGKFKQIVDVSRSLTPDARHHVKHKAKTGEGDKGNRRHRPL